MKRILLLSLTLLLLLLIPASLVNGQEKKEERNSIKIVLADKDGKKVVIDTTFTGHSGIDSIRLKDGKVIIIGNEGDHIKTLSHISGEKGNVMVTVTSDEKDGEKVEKTIIINGDEKPLIFQGEGGSKVMIMKSGNVSAEGKGDKVMTLTTTSDNEGGSVVYIKKRGEDLKDGEVKYNIEVKTDNAGKNIEKSSVVIAKDGMVVTIEGVNEEKVKELATEIESKLGVTKDNKTVKTEVIKEETKKNLKK